MARLARLITVSLIFTGLSLLASPTRADGILCQARKTVGILELAEAPFPFTSLADIRVADGAAFVVGLANGLYIVDVADPEHPALLSHDALFAPARFIDLADDILYASGQHIQIIDVSNPADPTVLHTIRPNVNYAPGAIDTHNGMLYTSQHSLGLTVYDVNDPANPVLIGSSGGDFNFRGLQVVGNLAYAVDDEGRLDIFDVSDPGAPSLVSRTLIGNPDPLGLTVVNGIVHALVAGSIMRMYDVADPSSPQLVGSSLRAGGFDITIVDGLAYTASATLLVNDLSAPANPRWLGEIELVGSMGAAIEVVDGLAYVLDRGVGLVIVDVTGSFETALIGRGPLCWCSTKWLEVSGNIAVIAGITLEFLDVSDPANPVVLHRTPDVTANYRQIQLVGDLAYVVRTEGLEIYDFSDPTQIARIGTLAIPGTCTSLSVRDHLAVVTAIDGSVRFFDVSVPSTPQLIGMYQTDGNPQGVCLRDDVVFVADREQGLLILDSSDPTNPILIGVYHSIDASAVDVRGTVACVAANDDGLLTFDVSNPAQPVLLSTFLSPNGARAVRFDGALAFKTDGLRCQIIDLADPSSPRMIGWFATSSPAPVRRGNLVYHGHGRFVIYDFSDCPSCPPDLIADESLDIMDVQQFLNLFAAGDDLADFNDDNTLNFFDVQTFLNLFAAGCP